MLRFPPARYSVRGLLFLVAVISVLLGLSIRKWHNQQRVVDLVKRLHGEMWYEYEAYRPGVRVARLGDEVSILAAAANRYDAVRPSGWM